MVNNFLIGTQGVWSFSLTTVEWKGGEAKWRRGKIQERRGKTQQYGETRNLRRIWPWIFRNNSVWFSIQGSFLFYTVLNPIIHSFSKELPRGRQFSKLWRFSDSKTPSQTSVLIITTHHEQVNWLIHNKFANTENVPRRKKSKLIKGECDIFIPGWERFPWWGFPMWRPRGCVFQMERWERAMCVQDQSEKRDRNWSHWSSQEPDPARLVLHFFLSWWFRQGVTMLWFTLLKLHPLGERVWGLDLEGVCWVWDSSSYPGYNLKENGKSRLSLKKSSQTVVTLDIWQKKKKGIKVFITRNWVNVDTT